MTAKLIPGYVVTWKQPLRTQTIFSAVVRPLVEPDKYGPEVARVRGFVSQQQEVIDRAHRIADELQAGNYRGPRTINLTKAPRGKV
jgi:hypothetical protein